MPSPLRLLLLHIAAILDLVSSKPLGKLILDQWIARQSEIPCYIGSAKADIGHAGAAAGLASLIKATLCLEQQIRRSAGRIISIN